jgi:hypothetical protein
LINKELVADTRHIFKSTFLFPDLHSINVV